MEESDKSGIDPYYRRVLTAILIVLIMLLAALIVFWG